MLFNILSTVSFSSTDPARHVDHGDEQERVYYLASAPVAAAAPHRHPSWSPENRSESNRPPWSQRLPTSRCRNQLENLGILAAIRALPANEECHSCTFLLLKDVKCWGYRQWRPSVCQLVPPNTHGRTLVVPIMILDSDLLNTAINPSEISLSFSAPPTVSASVPKILESKSDVYFRPSRSLSSLLGTLYTRVLTRLDVGGSKEFKGWGGRLESGSGYFSEKERGTSYSSWKKVSNGGVQREGVDVQKGLLYDIS
eukprot:569181-Hanusia_phi.AAC.2